MVTTAFKSVSKPKKAYKRKPTAKQLALWERKRQEKQARLAAKFSDKDQVVSEALPDEGCTSEADQPRQSVNGSGSPTGNVIAALEAQLRKHFQMLKDHDRMMALHDASRKHAALEIKILKERLYNEVLQITNDPD